MKSKVILLIASVLLSGAVSASSSGASKTEKFKVHGKCGMCESRIEQAAKTVDGVSAADWNKKTMEMSVAYDPSKTDIHKVHAAVAQAGHDTEMHRASDEAYSKLHNCCKYERPEKVKHNSNSDSAMPHCPQGNDTAGCCGGGNS